jgi:putative membrane protein insertion efficiency factor
MTGSQDRRTPMAVLSPSSALERVLVSLLLLLIGFYRRVISPGLRPRCRFLPSCSEYAELALHRHGLVRGMGKSLWRLARCQPLCKGGCDEP